jgi:hypothetical protein
MLTVVGGIVLALLTTLFQFVSARKQQDLVFRQQLRDKKYALLAAVAGGFHRDMIVLHKIKKMKGWLSKCKEGDMFEGALTRDELWILYKTVFELYVKENKTSALMAEVQAVFTDARVREEAQHLDGQFTNIDINRSPESEESEKKLIEKLDQFYTGTDDTLRKLERAMAAEINHT